MDLGLRPRKADVSAYADYLSISYCLIIVLATVLMVLLRWENKRREGLNLDEKEAERVAFDDLTDKENLHFRYVY